jgi:alpha-L-rhamnosidase
MVEHGATTIWERWDGWTEQRGFQSAWMNSFNHYALGSVGEWLYRFVLGIDQPPGGAGFRRLLVRPHPGGSLRAARGSYHSVRGLISSGWQHDGGTFRFTITIPPNASACIRVPSSGPEAVRDGTGQRPAGIADHPGRPGLREAVFEVGSGTHEFTGPLRWPGLAQ